MTTTPPAPPTPARFAIISAACRFGPHDECAKRIVVSTTAMAGEHTCACPCHLRAPAAVADATPL